MVEQQEGTASLLGIANVASTIFLKILLKTVVISAATFSSSFVCEFRFRFFFIALIIFILCGFRATCYGYYHGAKESRGARRAAEVLQSLFDFSQVIA